MTNIAFAQDSTKISDSNPITNFPVQEFFSNVQIHSITIDSRGLVYFALASGIVEFDGVEWRMISIPENAEINALAINNDGRIYGGGNNELGYLYVDDTGNTRFHSLLENFDSDFNDTVIDIRLAGDCVYFVGLHSILLLKNDKLAQVASGSFISSGVIGETLVVSDQENGLQYLNEDHELLPITVAKALRANKMESISANTILISTRSSGIFSLQVEEGSLQLSPWGVSSLPTFRTVSVSSIDVIKSNVIAFGTFEDGVILTDSAGNILDRIEAENGLLNNNVFNVFFSPNSTLWVGLNEGVSLIKIPSEITGIYAKPSPSLAEQDSIVTDETILSWFKQVYQSTIGGWFGDESVDSSATASILESADVFASIVRKVEYIPNDSLIFGGAFSQTRNGVQVLDQSDSSDYEFSYDFNAFRFSYSTNNFEAIDGLEFQVKLDGLDRDWSTWSKNTYREYTNLDWGDYTFLVRAKHPTIELSREASFSFSISPPWYEATWFYLLQFTVIMMALVISGILNKAGRAISLSEALIAVVVIIIFQYVEFYIEPYLDEYSNNIAVFKIGISIVFGFSLEFIEELFHKTVAKLTGLKSDEPSEDESLKVLENT